MMVIRAALAAAVTLGLLAAPLVAAAQPAGKVYKIGVLLTTSQSFESTRVEALRQAS